MSDPVGKAGQNKPEDALRPEAGFHDDHVGGQLKAEEAAKRRAQEAKVMRTPARILKEPEQVMAASSFLPAQQESEENASIRRQRALVAGQALAPRGQVAAKDGGAQFARAVRVVDGLFGALAEVDSGPAGPRDEGAAAAQRVERRPDGQRRGEGEGEGAEPQGEPSAAPANAGHPKGALAEAEQQARYHLQALIVGGGAAPLPDPASTFGPIFAALKCWPARVPPGHEPAGDADYDQFLAWVFAPLPVADDAAG